MKKLIISLLLFAAAASAQNKWTIETSHSSINFTVAHLVISEVTGRFREFSGKVESIRDDFSDMKLDVVIKANSIDTDEPKRDTHLKSPDFFDADRYPDITFKSTRVTKVDDNTLTVVGDLMMRGVTRSVELNVVFKGKSKNPMGQTVAIFKAATVINRTEWGLKWNRVLEGGGLLAGENVTLNLNIELVRG
ncbi:MAG: YceI family protein [Bacteroidota bacterium]|jgi:polyisoprenoid-binding protein YceI